MLKINWTQKVTNQDVLNIVHEERTMISNIRQRQHNWIGPVQQHKSLLKSKEEDAKSNK